MPAVDTDDTNNDDVKQLMTSDETSLVVGCGYQISVGYKKLQIHQASILCSVLLKSCPSYPP
jgi:hypothetical protein